MSAATWHVHPRPAIKASSITTSPCVYVYSAMPVGCDKPRLWPYSAPMVDTLTQEARSTLMSRVRQKDTSPEVRLRKQLHAKGLRYLLHPASLPGRPDLAFPRYRIAVFVHGCFWHGHNCRAGRLPSSNQAYWSEKIAANQVRDAHKIAELRGLGWRVAVVWECETKGSNLVRTTSTMVEIIRDGASPEISHPSV